eukprot:CAMPEP_0119270220 /NCGR_PEP_ID=MMETSP1329-20130426/7313_1 /TAXON_ID=114041 /ORGANISM="Genus nov. species nov., Strain RCC1024" /LENGTH=120 /DNA_ID=CAMNT_0007270231 /DNA_START=160 /DNA_END=518 /DNA_ORIENTATION=+
MASLETSPIATKCATSGALMLASDALRQRLEQAERDDDFRWDAARTARMTAFAIGFHAPFLHHLHIFYEALWPRLGVRHTAVKIALDQAFAAPAFLTTFLTYTSISEGLGVDGAALRIET